jgi:CRP/FNR family transcriptional regulator, cyclic AMP receptor protein
MGKLDVEGVLARNSWFASLPAELSESILHAGRIRSFESSLIYSADDTEDGLFALVSGQIRLMRTSANGKLTFLAIASPGAWFGVSGALDGRPHAYRQRIDNGVRIDLRLSQEDWAAMVGVGRQTINRLFKKLEEKGIASVSYASITIHRMDALESLVADKTVQDS